MSQAVKDQNTLRRYLLGELMQEELDPVEERLLVENNFFEEFELVKEDLIDLYVNQQLTPEELQRFEQFFLTTAERREDVRHAQALARQAKKSRQEAKQSEEKKHLTTERSRRGFLWEWLVPTPSLRFAATLILIIGVGFLAWRTFIYRSDLQEGLMALKTAYKLQRPVEARVSGLDYAPGPARGGNEIRVDAISRDRAAQFLFHAEKDEPGPESYHALGLFYLTEKKFDQATEEFKKALELKPTDAQIQSDLGAALLEKGKLYNLNGEDGKGLEAFAESIEHLNRALELNPDLLEALFNRALVRQYMGLPQAAAEDWRKYLEKDSHGPWADEAQQRLKDIQSQISENVQNKEEILPAFLKAFATRDDETAWQLLCLNRDGTGVLVENQLLDRYLSLEASGRLEDAKQSLHALSYAGELEFKRANDHFLKDLVQFYQPLTRSQRAALAEARSLMGQGHDSLKKLKAEAAAEYYSKARLIFDRIGDDIESLYLRFPMAHTYLSLHQSERALAAFKGLIRDAEAKNYQWLLSQSLSGIANAQSGLDNYSAALANNYRSLEISEKVGDINGLMKSADQLSIVYTRLGNYSEAVARQSQGVALINKHYVEPRQTWRTYFLIATPLHLLGLNAAAELFQKESLRVANQAGSSYYICRSYIGLAVIYGSQRNFDEATKNAHLAFDLAKSNESPSSRSDTVGYSSLQLGHLYRQSGDFNKAMESYDEVLKTYGPDYPAFAYAAHKGKLLSCIAQGGCPTVEQEVDTTLDMFEKYRAKIVEEENKFVFFDAEQNVYDAVIEYEYSINRNSSAAFDLSERSRARALLSLTTQEIPATTESDHQKQSELVSPLPLRSSEIAQRMPEQAQIIQYSVLPNKILIWLLSRSSGIQTFEQVIDTKDLREKVSRYLQLLTSPSLDHEEELKSASVEFYDLLIKPVEAALDRKKQLCIVPDKALNYLSYGAFVSGSSGKYLTDEYVLTRAPSSTLFIFSSERAIDKNGVIPEHLLSVGNPPFDRLEFPALADLPSAKKEAEEVARLYNAPAFTGDKAVKNRVVAEMENADVIHLALHAVVNEHSPMRSKLLFAHDRSSEGTDTLEIGEIDKFRLPHTRLVVLSACESGAGRYYDGEGTIGISRPFIAKGVPLVVASLWPVDSDATAKLMIAFHKNRIHGLSTAEALAFAQRALIAESDQRYRHPYYWAPFVTIGGYAQF
jgi:CHAT domain-containing protein/Tfp pilus assembly protein PilF